MSKSVFDHLIPGTDAYCAEVNKRAKAAMRILVQALARAKACEERRREFRPARQGVHA